MRWRVKIATAICCLVPLSLVGAAPATATGKAGDTVDLDVMFIGAHPDDEAGQLGMLGYWNEQHDIEAGVITMTRGEGGGNAVGLEEGPPLGIIREDEERRATGWAGVEHIYNLDAVDFYYTASAPLSEQIWGYNNALSRIVRVLRTTRPEVIITMNPSATQGNHGNHQEAAMLAVEAFYAAADPNAFPEQIKKEGLEPWRVARIFQAGGSGSGANGPTCETAPFTPSEPTNVVFGTWQGYEAARHDGTRWNQVNVWARREYASQGWASTGDAATNPASIGCNRITMIDSRTPYPDPTVGGTAALQGTNIRATGGLPLGTELHLRPERWEVLPGLPLKVDALVRGADRAIPGAKVSLSVPAGWSVRGDGNIGTIPTRKDAVARFTVTPPQNLTAGARFSLRATMTSKKDGTGSNTAVVQATAPVRGTLEPLPEIAKFRQWTEKHDVKTLDALIPSLLSLPSGGTRPIRVDLTNHSDQVQSGSVRLTVPAGFSVAESQQTYTGLQPGARGAVTFTVTNTDTSLPTANRAPNDGAYPVGIQTSFNGGEAVESGTLNLVPVTTIPAAATAPTVDGTAGPGEYSGETIDISTRWEGTAAPPADISGTARLTYTDDALYVLLDVTDDVLGSVLRADDCKRPRRNDNIEFGIDPRGNSGNTSTVFNVALFPTTVDPANGNPPCFARERDNRQGPGPVTAPGMQVASIVTNPYLGYRIEAKIPFDVLPDTIDPDHMGLEILVNDSDTQDLSGQTRTGWSTWTGVRADPWRWGIARLDGYPSQAPAPKEPVFPATAALSVDSPQTLVQSAEDGVAPGGWRALPNGTVRIDDVETRNRSVTVDVRTRQSGTVRAFVWDGDQVLASTTRDLGSGRHTLTLPLEAALPAGSSILLSYQDGDATTALARALKR
ncbi:PIG-L family deacetylase [Plantactinospora sp. S1510]|uniref:PIG-L family deacetylase n=1 Tax=Plantactinospora alkalitolerans TaxID=2789879 RepID=A0ABS0H3Y1_9ACTN|nr:sugar-binding protein [Plantactinospora alkalitolerans]MBF9133162.1 PIG-L family deacetylase [Plantactinospora alkalitolerans]